MEKLFNNTFLIVCYNCKSFFQQTRFFYNSNNLLKGAFPYFNKHKPVTDPARQDPNYFENEAKKLNLGKFIFYKKLLKIF